MGSLGTTTGLKRTCSACGKEFPHESNGAAGILTMVLALHKRDCLWAPALRHDDH